MTDMPTTYESKTTTTVSSGPSRSTIGCHPEYLRTIPGILKIVEIVLDLIVIICAASPLSNGYYGSFANAISLSTGGSPGGWVMFVAATAIITTGLILLAHLIQLYGMLNAPWSLIEFIYYCIFTVFFLIAFIVSAVYAHFAASIGACAFFCAAATAVYAVDTFFQFRAWRTGETEMVTTTTTTSTQQEPVHY